MIRSSHTRALRAASAVTLGTTFACCGGGGATDAAEPLTQDNALEDERPTLVVPDAQEPQAESLPTIVIPDSPVVVPVGPVPAVDQAGPPAECSKTLDDVCPESCTAETDADCCEARNANGMWCSFSSEWGCSCAIEGPFAPPA